jgi:CheY-like chemotaxis protein
MPTALIVEDEPQANKLLSMLVQLRGFSTESAFSGQEALEKVRARVPDVVFLDLMLPDFDGYQVCRELKASGTTNQIPVVIVTARVAAENRVESFYAGADDYIPKPYTPDQIFKALDDATAILGESTEPHSGSSVVLDCRDDGETLRQLARLRGAINALGGPNRETTDQISKAISALWSSALSWAHRSGLERVATLDYRLTPEALELIVKDEAGWLGSSGGLAQITSAPAFKGAGFDQIECGPELQWIRLVKELK